MKFNCHGGGSITMPLPNTQGHRKGKAAQGVTKLLLVMKLTIILLTVFCLHAAARTQGQVNFAGKQVPLVKVFEAIEAQTEYKLAYNPSILSGSQQITISLQNATVEQAMKEALKGQQLQFTIVNKTIFISAKAILPKLENNQTAKRINLRGKLVNKNKEPIEGATISVRGTDKVTVSDHNGEFFISEVEDDATIVVSSVAYQNRVIAINGREELSLELDIKTSDLKEISIIASTGFQTLPKERTTGSFVQIDNELLNRRVSTNVLNRLEGITSGLLFDKQSENGLGVSIRGRSTIFANTQPLVILDNFPFEGNLQDINPNDIESVTILRDAASASIWGAFSGNGVIVLTSKKGKINQPLKLGLNTNLTISNKPDLFYDPNFLPANEFVELEKYLFGQGFYNNDLTNSTRPVISPAVNVLNQLKNGTIDQAQADALLNTLKNYDIRNDYSKYLYQKAITQQYTLNLSGGGNKSSYYVSGNYDKSRANIQENSSERITLNSQYLFNPIKNLDVTVRYNYSLTKNKNNGINSIAASGKYSTIYPYARLADEQGNYLSVPKLFNTSFVDNPGVTGLQDWNYNPLQDRMLNNSTSRTVSTRIYGALKYHLTKTLNTEISYQYQESNATSETEYDQGAYYTRNLINQYSIISNGKVTGYNIPLGGIKYTGLSSITAHSGRAQVNYNEVFGRHELSAIGGIEVRETKMEGSSSTVYGYDPGVGSSVPVDYKTLFTLFPSFSAARIPGAPLVTPYTLDRYRSYFANASYTYAGRYTLTGSARVDQSNLFGVRTNQKGVPLWSMGARWQIDKESFYHLSWLPILRSRITYGYNGNIDKGVTAITTATFINNNLNNAPFAQIQTAGNPELRWEKIGMLNIALDFAFRKQLLSGSIELYTKRGKDLFGDALLPSSSGFLQARGNFANMSGSGVDVNLSSVAINTESFSWTIDALFSYVQDKITRNEGTNKQIGKPVNSVYSYQWGGLDPLTGDPIGYLGKSQSKDYNAIINASNKDPFLYVYSGRLNPQYFGGLRNTFKWRQFSASANITYKAGYVFRNSSIVYSSLFSLGYGHKDYSQRWQKPGDEQQTNVPSLVYPANDSRDLFYLNSEVNIQKGDHIRLQDVSVTYDLDLGRWFKKSVSALQLYFYANNLGLIWRANDKQIDPDYQSGYINPKTYSIGARINM